MHEFTFAVREHRRRRGFVERLAVEILDCVHKLFHVSINTAQNLDNTPFGCMWDDEQKRMLAFLVCILISSQ
jgi:hypothetical protein